MYMYECIVCLHVSYIVLKLFLSLDDEEEVSSSPTFEQQDPIEKMSYTMQALKRNHCYRLTRFIRLCDYLVINMLHDLTLSSIQYILSTLEGFLQETIKIEEIAQPIKEDEDEDESIPLLPLKTHPSFIQNTPSVCACVQ